MQTVFPFGFPAATAFYFAFYVLTLVVHVVFMNYVLAGTGYIAVAVLVRRGAESRDAKTANGHREAASDSISWRLRDWMPFALGMAVTAGVAPFLFVQILYQRNFYTANLLLFLRWLAILPVLIAGSYTLYLLKSRAVARRAAPAGAALGLGAFLCFAFTAYSWAENHLLGTREEIWPSFYTSGALFYTSRWLWARFAMWLAGSIPTLGALLGWQIWLEAQRAIGGAGAPAGAAGDAGAPAMTGDTRRVAMLAQAGLLASAACGALYLGGLPAPARALVTGALARPYLVAAALGLAVQFSGWVVQLRRPALEARWLVLVSAGLASTLIGTTVVREAIRLSAIDIGALFAAHARAAQSGGLPVFLAFLVLNAVFIGVCVRLVWRRPGVWMPTAAGELPARGGSR